MAVELEKERTMDAREFRAGISRIWCIVESECLQETVQVSGLCNWIDKLEIEYRAGRRYGIREKEFSSKQDDPVVTHAHFFVFPHTYLGIILAEL